MVESNEKHEAKWQELQSVVTPNWPLAVYEELAGEMPPAGKIRLDSFESSGREVKLLGMSTSYQPANILRAKLKKNKFLQSITRGKRVI